MVLINMSLNDFPENLLDLSKKQIEENRKEIYDKYAQKPSINDRRYQNLDNNHPYNKFADRDEFLRDRDRIIFSKAFRRLEHKAQVYSHEKGDHFRTRLTHTLEVMQIAKSIGKNLGLNEDLIEAIALGHDIGHTPFGHSGEEALDRIMRGEDNLGGKLEFEINYGGFKHNFHSLRILDILERKYEKNKGLNLTWQVLEGILKHTKVRKEGKEWELYRFVQSSKNLEPFMTEKYMDYPVTLEGQVVAIADEIAQRQHDLDDGLRDKDLNLRENKIIGEIQDTIKDLFESLSMAFKAFKPSNRNFKGKKVNKKDVTFEEIELLQLLKEKIEKREEKKKFKKYRLINKINDIQSYCKIQNFPQAYINSLIEIENKIDSTENNKQELSRHYVWNSLVRDITEYFILDVTLNSLNKIIRIEKEAKTRNYNNVIRHETWSGRQYLLEKIIDFSTTGKEIDNKIENYINNSILNSYDVNRFDAKADYILRQIFKAYYSNPRQMPKELLEELSNRIQMNSKWYGCEIRLKINLKDKIKDTTIDKIKFKDSSPKEIKELEELLRLEISKERLEQIFIWTYEDKKFNLNLENLLKNRGYYINREKDYKSELEGYLETKCSKRKYKSKLEGTLKDIDKNKYKSDFDEKLYHKWLLSTIYEMVNRYKRKDIHKIADIKEQYQLLFLKCLLEQHYAYISIICDHIAMMTDNYAKNEYERLYLV